MARKAASKKTGRTTKQERIGNLFLLLSSTTKPLPLEYIVNKIDGYTKDSHSSQRQMFERDKAELRAGGISIETKQMLGENQYGYIIDSDEPHFRSPDLTDEETSIIGLALKMITVQDLGQEMNQLAAIKFNTLDSKFELRDPILISYDDKLTDIYDHIQKGQLIKCLYGGKERFIIPGSLKFAIGSWYLVGCQIGKNDLQSPKPKAGKSISPKKEITPDIIDSISITDRRTLRLDKMLLLAEEVPVSKDLLEKTRLICRETAIPSDLPPTADIIAAKIKIPGTRTDVIHNWLTTGGKLITSKDGYVVMEAYVSTNYKSTVPRLISFGTQIEILEPRELRQEMMSYLNSYLEKPSQPFLENPQAATIAEYSQGQNLKVISQLNRMFTLVAYIARRGNLFPGGKCLTATIAIKELMEVFGDSRESIIKEIEALAMFGLPPYTADNLLEVFWESEEVTLTLTEGFLHLRNPFKLTLPECLILAAALKTLEQIVDTKEVKETIGSCLEKLNSILNVSDINIDMQIEPELLQKIQFLQTSAQAHEVVEISYPTKQNTLDLRFVRVFQVVFREGQFYLDGYCYTKNKFLRFSVVKINSARRATPQEINSLPQSPKKLPPEFQKQSAFIPGESTLLARIEVTPTYAHVFAPHQNKKPEITKDGNYIFEIEVGNTEWLAGLLLSTNYHAKVLTPPELTDTDIRLANTLRLLYDD